MPELTKTAEKYAAKGLVVVAPSLDAEDDVKKFRTKHKLDFAMLADAEKVSEKYKVEAYPTMFIVGKDGKVVWKGHFKDDAMIKKLEAELDKK